MQWNLNKVEIITEIPTGHSLCSFGFLLQLQKLLRVCVLFITVELKYLVSTKYRPVDLCNQTNLDGGSVGWGRYLNLGITLHHCKLDIRERKKRYIERDVAYYTGDAVSRSRQLETETPTGT